MKTFIQKISSRKFQIAVTMVIAGLVAMFSEGSADQATALAQKIIGGNVLRVARAVFPSDQIVRGDA